METNDRLLNEPLDVSSVFRRPGNTLFVPARTTDFDAATGRGRLECEPVDRAAQVHFNQVNYEPGEPHHTEFPPAYEQRPVTPFELAFVTPRTVRLRWRAARVPRETDEELMLAGPVPRDETWETEATAEGAAYTSADGVTVTVQREPWGLSLNDGAGPLVQTVTAPSRTYTPFCFVRRLDDLRRHVAASFPLAPDEKLFGCGESFTRLNKRGQKLVLWPYDSWECQGREMYKPIPFFLSSRGYGMFLHTSVPVTFDFGHTNDGVCTIFTGDDELDLFIFLGEPKQVLAEYTALTGRSPTPPLWSFGLWMSRITYDSEEQVRSVASRLRQERVPCDVIHLDTGWFEKDWCCDYQFARSRFDDPEGMIADLREQGFRTCLWQLPYFTPANRLYDELIEDDLVVNGPDGGLPTEDAILDFSNPDAVEWYQQKLAGLLRMGVGAIKVDFGEGAPLHGRYASGRSGFCEHNLYPLRYNRAAAEVTRQVTGEDIIWARSAWAGSQRYPVHWGGDAISTDSGMAATLRAGLSFGLCGFSFWSHDVGGFTDVPGEDLYVRWLAFGVLTSHTRCHGQPPREPWEFAEGLTRVFRRTVELKYRLMPYVYAQARDCSERGLPMLRALFLEYPDDPTSWLVEDEYLFGRDLLVAPLLEAGATDRRVYVPPGRWMGYWSGQCYDGARWHQVEVGDVPVVLLVREGAALPTAGLAQCTDEIDWGRIELHAYRRRPGEATGLFCRPDDHQVRRLRVRVGDDGFELLDDPTGGEVDWTIRGAPGGQIN
ncbi:MAG: glycoside hydrolase family 31 protein [Candidatus Brocadiia bacterium]